VPKRGLGDTSVAKIIQNQEETGRSFVDAMLHADEVAGLQARAINGFQELGNKLQALSEIAVQSSPEDLLKVLLKKIDYLEYLDDGSLQSEARIENVNELLSVAKEFDSLDTFLEEVALVSSADTSNDGDAVTMMTLHAAKGLEFPVVFMVGMEEGVFPLARATFDASELEEERRLAYVGITRAREELVMTAASQRLLYGNYQNNMPSRFLSDIDAYAEHIKGKEPVGWQSNNPLSMPDFSPEPTFVPDQIDLEVGDKVQHKIFGTGFVEGVDGSVVAVKFPTGLKKLNVAFAPLEKL
jgi:DNA helicase-2/ATP-dependent DNA helicase PcrA